MCDCAEEQLRQADKRAEQSDSRSRSPARSSSGTSGEGVACYADDQTSCRFFTCGLWAGGVGAGGWLPYAGSALLLALMAYMFRNMRKHTDKLGKFGKLPKMGNLFGASKPSTVAKQSFQCDYSK